MRSTTFDPTVKSITTGTNTTQVQYPASQHSSMNGKPDCELACLSFVNAEAMTEVQR